MMIHQMAARTVAAGRTGLAGNMSSMTASTGTSTARWSAANVTQIRWFSYPPHEVVGLPALSPVSTGSSVMDGTELSNITGTEAVL
jgi:hypothetical protein